METHIGATEAYPVAVEAHTGAEEAIKMEPRGSYSSGSRHFNQESNPDQHHSESSDRIRICIRVISQIQS